MRQIIKWILFILSAVGWDLFLINIMPSQDMIEIHPFIEHSVQFAFIILYLGGGLLIWFFWDWLIKED